MLVPIKPGKVDNNDMPPQNLFGYFEGSNSTTMKVTRTDLNPIVYVGGTVFGLNNSPLVKEVAGNAGKLKYSFNAPTQLLKDSRKIVVREPFQSNDYSSEFAIDLDKVFMPSQLAVIYSNTTDTSYVISGGYFDRCKNITIVAGDNEYKYEPQSNLFGNGPGLCLGSKPNSVSSGAANVIVKTSSLITVKIPQSDLKGVKQIFVIEDGEEPVMLALEAVADVPDPTIDKQDEIQEGNATKTKLTGTNLASISDITFEGKSVVTDKSNNGIVVNAAGTELTMPLPSSLVGSAGQKQLTLVLKNGKSKSYILLVGARKAN